MTQSSLKGPAFGTKPECKFSRRQTISNLQQQSGRQNQAMAVWHGQMLHAPLLILITASTARQGPRFPTHSTCTHSAVPRLLRRLRASKQPVRLGGHFMCVHGSFGAGIKQRGVSGRAEKGLAQGKVGEGRLCGLLFPLSVEAVFARGWGGIVVLRGPYGASGILEPEL